MPTDDRPCFVIRPRAAGAAAPPGATALDGPRPGWTLPAPPAATPGRAAWQALQAELGDAFQVLPVLRDEHGEPRYPTGELLVRFRAPVDDARLAGLATAAGLQLVRRSAFTRNQAVYRPLRPQAAWAPELLERLAADHSDVESAWLDAEGRYRRQD